MSIKKTIEVDVNLHPSELANYIWEGLDAKEQAYLLLHLAENYNYNRGKTAIQLDYVADEMANYFTNEDVRSINRFLDLVRDYTENALSKDTEKEF